LDFLEDRKIDVVLDIGANVGQFGRSLRNKGYRGKIVSFEPLGSEFEILAAEAKADRNWEAHNFALGSASGSATINVSANSVFSSILNVNSVATEFDSGAAVKRTETIKMRTLDEIFPTLAGEVLLKIDTQGYEKQVLEGGRQMLPKVKGILLELPIIRIYKGTWQFHEAAEFMASIGFVPAQIEPVSYHSKDKVSLVEVDCLFRPRDIQLD
jgi:FkbM family methyltransferase